MVLWRPTRPFRTNTKKRCPFHYRGLECKSRKSRDTWGNRQIWPWSTELSRAKVNRVLPREHTGPIISHIHSWVFLLWLRLFILSGVISSLISSSLLGTYHLGEFLFQCPMIFPFHTVHGVLKARILKWFAIPFSSGPHCVRTLHHDPSILSGPTWHGS